MDTRTTILLADDQLLVREGIKCLLETYPEFQIVGESDDGLAVVEMVAERRPDVLLVDVALPGLYGPEVVRRVRDRAPGTAAIVLSRSASSWYVVEALKNGAKGYVVKQAAPDELIQAVRTAAAGEFYLSTPLSRVPLDRWMKSVHVLETDPYEGLTNREREVLQLVAEGYSNEDLARRLGITRRTVEAHRAAVMQKLDLRNQVGLVRYAFARGLIQPPEPLSPMLARLPRVPHRS